jgi:hypothetical protein
VVAVDTATIVRTLIVNGYHLDAARRMSGHFVLDVRCYDRFDNPINYSFAIFDGAPGSPSVAGFLQAAERNRRIPIVIRPESTPSVPGLLLSDFFLRLGGPIDHSVLLRPDLCEILDQLGRNALPSGMAGKPEDLLEEFVKMCLEYLFGQKAHRWGSERRFEPLPDGVAIGPDNLVLLFDGKAYSRGFELTAEETRKAKEYVTTFNGRYGSLLAPVFAFVIVSSSFTQGEAALRDRSNELYAACQAPLCAIKAAELGAMVQLLTRNPMTRPSIQWRRVFADPVHALEQLSAQVESLDRDPLTRTE